MRYLKVLCYTTAVNVNSEMMIYRQETFGPVAAVIVFDDYEQVIEMANDTRYGLAAAAPFGGMNESGLGREGAREGLNEYLETKLGGFSI